MEDLEPDQPLDSMNKEEFKAYKKKNRAHKRKVRKEERETQGAKNHWFLCKNNHDRKKYFWNVCLE